MSRRRKPFSEYGPRVQKKLPDAAVPVNGHGDSMAFFGADMAASAICASRRIGDAGGRHGHASPENSWKFLGMLAGRNIRAAFIERVFLRA